MKAPLKRKLQKTLVDAGDVAMCAATVNSRINYRGIALSGLIFESPLGQQVPVPRYATRWISRESF